MTTSRHMQESDGEFTARKKVDRYCGYATCQRVTQHRCELWESHDGAFEDEKFTCLNCGLVEWVDGIDS